MKVWGYFDASGTHDNLDRSGKPSPAVSVAGYLATPLQWQRFDNRWREILGDAGVPYFHATDFVARVPPFDGWTEEKRKGFTLALIDAISGNVTYGIGMAVVRAEYENILVTYPITRKAFGTPYTFCCHMCLWTGSDWAHNRRYNDTIKYVFESGDFSQEILAAHSHACNDDRLREFFRFGVGGLTFEDGVKTTPLQAADFLAYEMYREMGRHLQPNPGQTYTRNSFMALLQIAGEYKMYGKDEVIGYLHDYGYLSGPPPDENSGKLSQLVDS